MKYLIVFLLSFSAFGSIKDRVEAIPWITLAAQKCGLSEPNGPVFKRKIINENDLLKLECLESKVPEINALIQKQQTQRTNRKTCKSYLDGLEGDATGQDQLAVINCLLKER